MAPPGFSRAILSQTLLSAAEPRVKITIPLSPVVPLVSFTGSVPCRHAACSGSESHKAPKGKKRKKIKA